MRIELKIIKLIFSLYILFYFYIINIKIKREYNNKLFNINDDLLKKINNSLINIKDLKKVVYTIILGKYDKVKSFNKEIGYDYFLFTDIDIKNNNIYNNSNWTLISIPEEINKLKINKIKKQRLIKLNPHLFFGNYDLSIYIDGSIKIKGNLDEFLSRIISPNYSIYTLEHPFRNSIFDELSKVLKLFKENKYRVNNILKRYKKEKYNLKNGLIESNIMIRKHNEKNCINIMSKWSKEIINYSHRDQLSFNYILWKTGMKIKYIPKIFALEYFKQFSNHLIKLIIKNI